MTSDGPYYANKALEYYTKYLLVQKEIDDVETEALLAAQGNKRAAAMILLKPKEETEASFYYRSLCGDRDMWMDRAQLASSMAIMLAEYRIRKAA